MDYANLKFMGREFKSEGEGKKGPWKLYQSKFKDEHDGDVKMTAFSDPKKGLCITALTEGETYNVGWKEKERTFTNDQQEEITYNAKTIAFISEARKPNEVPVPDMSPVAPAPVANLIPPAEGVVAEFKPTPEENVWLEKLKALPQENVTEEAFKQTLSEPGRVADLTPEKLTKLYKYYTEVTLKTQ